MKFSENWLRTYVNPTLDSEALGHALTMAGLEVEGLETVAPAFDGEPGALDGVRPEASSEYLT